MPNKPNFTEERAKLQRKCVYLADGGFLQRVEWFRMQDFDRVITVEEAERFAEEQKIAALSQDSSDELEVPPPRPAILAAIVRFRSQDRFYLSACAGWTRANLARFAECRASAIAEDPSDVTGMIGDFEKGVDNMVALCNKCSPEPQAVGLFDQGNSPQQPCFKVGHRILGVRMSSHCYTFFHID